jgi:hypothetical protein
MGLYLPYAPIASEPPPQVARYKRAATLLAALFCVVATLVAADQGVLSIALNLGFWLCVFALASAHAPLSQLRLFLPLTLLFYSTFYFNREVVEIWDKILNSDTPRYLLEAKTFRTQTRHLGFPVITFPYVAVNRLGSTLFGLSNLGREFLYLQVALAGTLGATLIHATLLQYESSTSRLPRIRAVLVAYVFALSFAVWSLSSVIDTFMVSSMLLLMFLLDLRYFFLTESTISCVTLALITVVALLISLENVYFIGLFGLALTYRYVCGHRRWIVKHGLLYLTIAVVTFALVLQIAALAAGPDFYRTSGDASFPAPSTNLKDNLYRYIRRFVDLEGALSVWEAMRVGFRTWVMAITAQQDVPVEDYVIPSRRLTTGNLVYFSLVLPLVVVGMRGLMRRLPRHVRFMVIVLIGMLMIRYVFMLVYARDQNALFATPSIAGFWLLIGLGLSQHSDTVRRWGERVVVAVLTILGIFLLINNGYYLLHIT